MCFSVLHCYHKRLLEKPAMAESSPEEDCEFKSPPICTLSGHSKQEDIFSDFNKAYDNIGYIPDSPEQHNLCPEIVQQVCSEIE